MFVNLNKYFILYVNLNKILKYEEKQCVNLTKIILKSTKYLLN